ncbi:suppressor of fused domain protein [Nocardia paucivorans]|uniref:suppressor of fused domain protein n=1 Tax=Nocardia paucivorans TaxID=114259 RepID=UPI0002F8C309|nr:suppressor of fused domain protein [Nocardia paucivorans]
MRNFDADPNRYAGLLAHTEHYLGSVTPDAEPKTGGRNRGFTIGFHTHPRFGMVSAVTTGVRFRNLTTDLPQEFVVSALPEQRDEAAYLLHVVADRVVVGGRGYEYGGGYINIEPLIPGSGIEFLLAWTHPYTDDGFDLYRDEHDEPALRYITLIPATRAEFEFARDRDDPLPLLELWESHETLLLDIYRPSAI